VSDGLKELVRTIRLKVETFATAQAFLESTIRRAQDVFCWMFACRV